MPFPDYDIATETLGVVQERLLYDAIVNAGPYSSSFLSVVVNHDTQIVSTIFDIPPDAGNQVTVTGVVNASGITPLAEAKLVKNGEIDERTEELILQGFEYPIASGILFSLSRNAQRSLLTADAQRTDPLFAYPVIWNNKNDTSIISLANAIDLHAFVMTAVGTGRAWLDSGTVLKDQVRAAVNIAAVDAIVDNR